MKPTRDYYSERLPLDPRLRRDTDTLAGKLTDADRALIAKRWNRATKLGALKVMAIKARRDAKRGFEI